MFRTLYTDRPGGMDGPDEVDTGQCTDGPSGLDNVLNTDGSGGPESVLASWPAGTVQCV